MARTNTSGKVLTTAPSAKATRAEKKRQAATASVSPEFAEFAGTWNELEKDRRRQIRRLIRIGQPQESVADAELAIGFATYQRTRPWFRFFWLWIVPLTIAGIMAGANVHAIVIGLVLGAAASAALVRRNFKRVEKVNAELLAGDTIPATA